MRSPGCFASRFVLLASLALALGSCRKSDESSAAPAPTADAPALPEAVDPDDWDALSAARQGCSLDIQRYEVGECGAGQLQALAKRLQATPKAKTRALPAVVYALAHEEPEYRLIGAQLLATAYRDLGQLQASDPEPVRSLLQSLATHPPALMARAAAPIARLAALAGLHQELYAVLDQHEDRTIRVESYRALARHGGAAALQKLKQLATGNDLNTGLAALDGLLATERVEFASIAGEICPWVSALERQQEPGYHERAVALWMRCGESYFNQAIDFVIEQSKSPAAGRLFVSLQDLCRVPRQHERCPEIRKLLLATFNDTKRNDDVRLGALKALVHQWSDPQIQALLRRASASKQNQIRITAEAALKQLQAGGAGPKPAAARDQAAGARAPAERP